MTKPQPQEKPGERRLFPVMFLSRDQRVLGIPELIDWAFVEPHRKQAQTNHNQTLEQLADRGGLTPAELVAVLEDRKWSPMSDVAAANRFKAILKERTQ